MDVLRNHFPGLTGELNLKWPNDLLLDDKKLAGFLGEQSEGSFRLGVGINVNNDLDGSDFRLEATSLREQLETDVDSTSILFNWYRGFVDCLDRADECRHFEPEELESRLGTMGKEVIVENTRGEVLGLDTNGALRVDFNGDKRSIHRTDQVEILHQ
jgi:BirA family biotin operon repressor/biotin-[acetyl-CoA-carboxylase] ligase